MDINIKGQLSIEFILILTVIILLLQVLILPMKNTNEKTITDFTKTAHIEKTTKNIISKINFIKNYDSAKINFEIYIPKDCNLIFDNNKLKYFISFDENMPYKNCKKNICYKEYDLNINSNYKKTIIGEKKAILTIEKNQNIWNFNIK